MRTTQIGPAPADITHPRRSWLSSPTVKWATAEWEKLEEDWVDHRSSIIAPFAPVQIAPIAAKEDGTLADLCLGLFLSNLETTIVSTSLVSITDDLHGFGRSSWIVTAYLLTYTGFLIILAKLSDIFGRKNLLGATYVIFITFSIGCGLAPSMTALEVLRAFQGIGGGGINAMTFVILPEMVPTEKYATYAAIISSTSALANLFGPILGGVITDHASWRWIFFLNGPVGTLAFVLMLIALPSSFPHQPDSKDLSTRRFTFENIKRVDWLGFLLLLAASILLVAALEEGGTEYSWHSPVTLSILIVALLLFPSFLAWERFQELRKTIQEPVFPWRLATNRFAMGVLLNTFCVGATFISVIINLPQRFQVINGDSPFDAGYRLLAITLSTSVGSVLAGILMQRVKLAPFIILLCSGSLQVVGLALLGSLPESSHHIPSAVYGYQVITGMGFGISLATAMMMVPMVVEKHDTAVSMGATGQFRMLGGSLGIAICTNVLNNSAKSSLEKGGLLSPAQLAGILESAQALKTLSPALQETVRAVFSEGYDKQMQVLTAFGAGAVLATLMMWERPLRRQI